MNFEISNYGKDKIIIFKENGTISVRKPDLNITKPFNACDKLLLSKWLHLQGKALCQTWYFLRCQ